MKWTELIDVVAERSGVPKSKARDVLTALVEVTAERLAAKEEVSLRGIGVFSTRWSKGRTLRSVESGRRMWVGGRFVPRFRPSKALKAQLVEETDQSWRDPEHQQAWRLAETLIGDLDLYHKARIPQDLSPDPESRRDRGHLLDPHRWTVDPGDAGLRGASASARPLVAELSRPGSASTLGRPAVSVAVLPEFSSEHPLVADLDWDGPSDVHVGGTGLRGEVVLGVNGAAWVGLIGPAGGESAVADAVVHAVSPLLQDAFRTEQHEDGTVFDTLWAGANAADERLRKKYSPVDPDGRAGLVLACIQHRAAFLVWTQTGAAYLLRSDEVVQAVEGGRVLVDSMEALEDLDDLDRYDDELDPPHAFLGGRPVDSSDLVLHEVDPPWMLRHGDRLVLSPCSLSSHLALDELVALLGSGPAEGAAHTLQTLLRVRSGVEAPVVVIEIGGLDEAELQADDDTYEHLLEGLEDLLPAAFAEQLEALERDTPADDLGEDATDPFAPVRGIGSVDDIAAPDLGSTPSSDLHYTPPGGTRLRSSENNPRPIGDTLIPSAEDVAPEALPVGDLVGLETDLEPDSLTETEEVSPASSAVEAAPHLTVEVKPPAPVASAVPSAVPVLLAMVAIVVLLAVVAGVFLSL